MDNEMINMECRHSRIALSTNQLREIVPENVFNGLDGKRTICFGSTDGFQKLQAIAIFSASEIHSQEMVLEYILVSEERRLEGLAHELLAYCVNTFKKCGIRSIYVRIMGEIEKIADVYDYLVREKYIPVVFCGHLFSYEFSDIRHCEMMRHGDELLGAFGRKIKKIEPFMDSGVRQMLQQEIGTYIRQDAYDTRYSRVLLDSDSIKGAVFLKQADKETVTMTGCYIEPGSNRKYLFAALLYSALHDLAASVGDDVRFVLQLYRSGQYEWVKKLLGEPRQDLILQEYVRKL